MADDMANYKSLVTTGERYCQLDLAANCFKNFFDEDKTVIPGRANGSVQSTAR